jgi:hypothetical protein
MQAVAKSIPEPLTPDEMKIYAEMHLRQPHYGNLPLLLLGERIGFVEGIVLDICEHPGDRRPVEILHRLLQYYATMVGERREADKQRKRKGSPSKPSVECKPDSYASPSTDQNLFSKITEHILAKTGQGCDCAEPKWIAELKDIGDTITLTADCAGCNAHREPILSLEEFAAFGQQVVHPEE